MKTVFLALILGFLALVVTLQIVFIRNRITKLNDSMIEKSTEVSKSAKSLAQAESKLRIYGITVDMKLSKIIATSPKTLQMLIKDVSTREEISVPYVCDTGALSVPAKIDKVSVLILHQNSGSTALVRDIANKEIRYILFNNEIFQVNVFTDLLSEVIIPYFTEQKLAPIASQLENMYAVVVYSLANHTPNYNEALTQDCEFSIVPFIGSINKKVSPDDLFDIMPSSIDTVINTHIVGYKTL